MPHEPVFFENAEKKPELVVGFMKKGTGVPSITWPESVDEALCVGWIDGVRHRIDDERYKIRFTPRRRGSHWSNINIRRVTALKAAGRMKAAGLPAAGQLVGHQRQESRDARAAAAKADQGLRHRPPFRMVAVARQCQAFTPDTP